MILTTLLGGLRVPLRFAALAVAVVLAGTLIFLLFAHFGNKSMEAPQWS